MEEKAGRESGRSISGKLGAEEEAVRRLEKELEETREERDISKKKRWLGKQYFFLVKLCAFVAKFIDNE